MANEQLSFTVQMDADTKAFIDNMESATQSVDNFEKQLGQAGQSLGSGMDTQFEQLGTRIDNVAGRIDINADKIAAAIEKIKTASSSTNGSVGFDDVDFMPADSIQEAMVAIKQLQQAKSSLKDTDEDYLLKQQMLTEGMLKYSNQVSGMVTSSGDINTILGKQAKTASEAATQNKLLGASMQHLPTDGEGVSDVIEKVNERYAENKAIIDAVKLSNTSITASNQTVAGSYATVDDALLRQATSLEMANERQKLLIEGRSQVDTSLQGATATMTQYNTALAENKAYITSNTSSAMRLSEAMSLEAKSSTQVAAQEKVLTSALKDADVGSEKHATVLTKLTSVKQNAARIDEANRIVVEKQKQSVATLTQELTKEITTTAQASAQNKRLKVIIDNLNQSESGFAKKMKLANKQMESNNAIIGNTSKKMKTMGNSIESVTSKTSQLEQFGNQMKMAFSIYGLERFISKMAEVRGEFEIQGVALSAMLQSKELADEKFAAVTEMAMKSPFKILDMNKSLKQLKAYQIANEELVPTLGMLSDVSAGLGVQMDRLILAYGQVKSASVLRGTELRQFTEAGIPLLDELAKKVTEVNGTFTTTDEIFSMISARKIPFEYVKEIFQEMTSEGGIFYNQQILQSETLSGQISILGDAYAKMLNNLGQGLDSPMKGGISLARTLLENYQEVQAVLGVVVGAYGLYKAALIFANIQQKIAINEALKAAGSKALEARAVASTTAGITAETFAKKGNVVVTNTLTGATKTQAVAQARLNTIMGMNPYVAILTAFTAVVAAMALYSKHQKEILNDAYESIEQKQKEVDKWHKLEEAINSAKVGSEEYNKAMKGIQALDTTGSVKAARSYGQVVTDNIDKLRAMRSELKTSKVATERNNAALADAKSYSVKLDMDVSKPVNLDKQIEEFQSLSKVIAEGKFNSDEYKNAVKRLSEIDLTGAQEQFDVLSQTISDNVDKLEAKKQLTFSLNLKENVEGDGKWGKQDFDDLKENAEDAVKDVKIQEIKVNNSLSRLKREIETSGAELTEEQGKFVDSFLDRGSLEENARGAEELRHHLMNTGIELQGIEGAMENIRSLNKIDAFGDFGRSAGLFEQSLSILDNKVNETDSVLKKFAEEKLQVYKMNREVQLGLDVKEDSVQKIKAKIDSIIEDRKLDLSYNLANVEGKAELDKQLEQERVELGVKFGLQEAIDGAQEVKDKATKEVFDERVELGIVPKIYKDKLDGLDDVIPAWQKEVNDKFQEQGGIDISLKPQKGEEQEAYLARLKQAYDDADSSIETLNTRRLEGGEEATAAEVDRLKQIDKSLAENKKAYEEAAKAKQMLETKDAMTESDFAIQDFTLPSGYLDLVTVQSEINAIETENNVLKKEAELIQGRTLANAEKTIEKKKEEQGFITKIIKLDEDGNKKTDNSLKGQLELLKEAKKLYDDLAKSKDRPESVDTTKDVLVDRIAQVKELIATYEEASGKKVDFSIADDMFENLDDKTYVEFLKKLRADTDDTGIKDTLTKEIFSIDSGAAKDAAKEIYTDFSNELKNYEDKLSFFDKMKDLGADVDFSLSFVGLDKTETDYIERLRDMGTDLAKEGAEIKVDGSQMFDMSGKKFDLNIDTDFDSLDLPDNLETKFRAIVDKMQDYTNDSVTDNLKVIQKWNDEIKKLPLGEGFEFDVQGVYSDVVNETNDATNEILAMQASLKGFYGGLKDQINVKADFEISETDDEGEKFRIDKQRNAEIDAINKVHANKVEKAKAEHKLKLDNIQAESIANVQGLAEGYIEDEMGIPGMNAFQSMSDLSIMQLMKLKDQLKDISIDDFDFSKFTEGVNLTGDALDRFKGSFENLNDISLDGLEPEKITEVQSRLAAIFDSVDVEVLSKEDIDEIQGDIQSLFEELDIPPEFKESFLDTFDIADQDLLASVGLSQESIDALIEKFGTLKGEMDSDVKMEFFERLKEAGDEILDMISGMVNGLQEFAEASGDTQMAKNFEDLADVLDVASATLQGAASGGPVGAAIAFTGSVGTKIIEAATAAATERAERVASDIAIQEAFNKQLRETNALLLDNSNIFGEDAYGSAMASLSQYTSALAAQQEFLSDSIAPDYTQGDTSDVSKAMKGFLLGTVSNIVTAPLAGLSLLEDKFEVIGKSSEWLGDKIGGSVGDGVADFGGWVSDGLGSVSGAIDNFINGKSDDYIQSTASDLTDLETMLNNIFVKTDSDSAWSKFWGTGNDEYTSVLEKYKDDLYDENGDITSDTLQTILDEKGDAMTDAENDALTQQIAYMKESEEAWDAYVEYLEDVFSDLGSTISDGLYDAFVGGEDYSEMFADNFSDLADQMIMDAIAAATYMETLSDMSDDLTDLIAEDLDPEALADEIDNLAESYADQLEQDQETADAMMEAIQESTAGGTIELLAADVDTDAETGTISGVTEDTALLIVAYMNTIREDGMTRNTLITSVKDLTSQQLAQLVSIKADTAVIAKVLSAAFDSASQALKIA